MAFQFFPGCAAVDGTVKAASGPAAVETPRSSPRLPQCREQDVGIAGIEHDVDATGLGVLIEHLLPGLAAILRAENAALFVVGKGMSERRDEGNVRILGIHREPPDGVRVGKANKLPGFTSVNRFVHSVAADNVAANACFSRSHINDVRIGFGNRNRSDRR